MSRPLRAHRYAQGASPSLIRIITEKLHYFSYSEATEFYADIIPHLKPTEMALLGCNDRYFLLTGLLNRPDAIHPWLYDRAREVEANPDGFLDLWARGHFKSSLISFAGVIQEVLIDPEIRVGIFGNTKEISRPFLSQIKQELESNEELKALYPDVLWDNPRADAPSWSVDGGITIKRIGNPKECSVEAHGLIDAMPTGRHFPLMVFDDIITEKNVTNPEQIRKATERVELADNLGIGDGTRKQMVGTRYSFADTYGHLLEHGIVTPRVYPATDDGTLNGKPVLLSQDAWDAKKKAQRTQIAAQMLQNPIAGQENTFHTKWLRPYWVRPLMANVYIIGDPSRGRSKTSDRTALVVLGMDALGRKYLLDGYCHRMPLSERWAKFKELHTKWSRMPGVQSVKAGYERYGLQSDDEYFDEKMRLEGKRFDIQELGWTGERGRESKTHRVERLEPDFRNGLFYVPGKVWHSGIQGHEARWFLRLEDEVDKDGIIVAKADDDIHYKPNPALEVDERRCKANGELWRLFDPIRRLDEDGNIYDLTRVFFEEFRFFPFSPRDDLIDAMSRIYDLEPMPAVRHERVEVMDYPDA